MLLVDGCVGILEYTCIYSAAHLNIHAHDYNILRGMRANMSRIRSGSCPESLEHSKNFPSATGRKGIERPIMKLSNDPREIDTFGGPCGRRIEASQTTQQMTDTTMRLMNRYKWSLYVVGLAISHLIPLQATRQPNRSV